MSFSNKRPILTTLLCCGIVFFMMFLLEPFGIVYTSLLNRVVLSLLFSLIPAIVFILFIIYYNPNRKNNDFSLRRQLLFYYLVVLPFCWLLVLLVIFLIKDEHIKFKNNLYTASLFDTYIVGSINFSFVKLMDYVSYYKNQLQNVKKGRADFTAGKIQVLINGFKNETIDLDINSIIYFESSGNNIKIEYYDNKIVKHVEIRKTFKELEKELEGYSCFIRIHKSFIVNKDFIFMFSGNSREANITLTSGDNVPVSRGRYQLINDELHGK